MEPEIQLLPWLTRTKGKEPRQWSQRYNYYHGLIEAMVRSPSMETQTPPWHIQTTQTRGMRTHSFLAATPSSFHVRGCPHG